MNKEIFIVGNGGREHAIGWKLKQDDSRTSVSFFPGNGGTQEFGKNYREDIKTIKETIQRKNGLVVIGPEKPLEQGIVNLFEDSGIRIFGPSREASELEWSKAWAQKFMERFEIPHALGEVFLDFDQACSYIETQNKPQVIKADGLAAGKGVKVCETKEEALEALRSMMIDREFGQSGETVVIQEKLEGREISIMAFCDGKVAISMIPARDYKRLLDGDLGPNTGGMGAHAPGWEIVNPETLEVIKKTILQPTVEYMRQIGRPYKGILYAGLMMTSEGPKVLEYNCRFGDPEIQVVLPLLDTNLYDLLESSVDGEFGNVKLSWQDKHCVCVVLASAGYTKKPPEDRLNTGQPISGLGELSANPIDDLYIFHSNTHYYHGRYYNKDGRVLGVTAKGETLTEASGKSYSVIGNPVKFPMMQYRKDIGKRD